MAYKQCELAGHSSFYVKKNNFTWSVICFGWTQVVVWALSVVFVKEPFLWHAGLVTCIQWDALCSALPCQLRILVSPTNEPHSPPFLTLSLFPFCFYKLTPLTLVFGSWFSHWKLISRLVNTMEPDSKRHAVCSALPAVLLSPRLDLLFVLIEFICLPSTSASCFRVVWRGDCAQRIAALPQR